MGGVGVVGGEVRGGWGAERIRVGGWGKNNEGGLGRYAGKNK